MLSIICYKVSYPIQLIINKNNSQCNSSSKFNAHWKTKKNIGEGKKEKAISILNAAQNNHQYVWLSLLFHVQQKKKKVYISIIRIIMSVIGIYMIQKKKVVKGMRVVDRASIYR